MKDKMTALGASLGPAVPIAAVGGGESVSSSRLLERTMAMIDSELQTQDPPISADVAAPSARIHWSPRFQPKDADLLAHNEIVIAASRVTVWRHLVEAPKWPDWYPNARDVRIVSGRSDVLENNSRFEFRTFGMHIDARVGEFLPERRLGWFGNGIGINAYHTWLLIEVADGCKVVTEKVAKGPAAVVLRSTDPAVVHKGHEVWLRSLKLISEQQNRTT